MIITISNDGLYKGITIIGKQSLCKAIIGITIIMVFIKGLLFKGNYDHLPNVMPEGEGGPGPACPVRERKGGGWNHSNSKTGSNLVPMTIIFT